MSDLATSAPLLDLVVPVHDEEVALAASVDRLAAHLSTMPWSWRITIVDNASTDRTWEIARALAAGSPRVRAVHLDEKGRGRALRAAWSASDATVVAYTDVDLSTDLGALLPLVDAIVDGRGDVAIGSRLAVGSRVTRGAKRELVSRAYNHIVRAVTRAEFSDAQCGFKAVRADVARGLLPEVENDNWFFDTELLLLAEHHGLRIAEVPVEWVDDPSSTVDIRRTAMEDLRGLARMTRRLFGQKVSRQPRLQRQVLTFAAIGAFTTIVHVSLFLLYRTRLSSLVANAIALALATPLNTGLNRLLTFGYRGRHRLVRDHVQAGVVFLGGLAMTSIALVLFDAVWPEHPAVAGVAAVLLANATITVSRFLLLRAWVFNPARRSARRTARR